MFGFNLFGDGNTFAGKTSNNTSSVSTPKLKAKQAAAWDGSNTTPTFDLTSGWTIGSGYVIQPNDIVIVTYIVGEDNNKTFDIGVATSGYIEVASTVSPNNNWETFISVSYKRMSSTPDTQVVLSGLGASWVNSGQAAVVEVWSDVDVTTPLDDVTPVVASGLDAFIEVPAIYPNSNEAVKVECGGYTGTFGASAIAGAEGFDFIQVNTGSYSRTYAMSAWKQAYDAPGNAWTSSQMDTRYSWAAAALVLRPASSTPPPSITRRLLARASSWLG